MLVRFARVEDADEACAMGHAAIETTALYANALGEEQRSIAERMWR